MNNSWWILSQACKIVGGQRYTKGLNEKQITSLLKVSCQRPREQETDILQVILMDSWCHSPTFIFFFIFWFLSESTGNWRAMTCVINCSCFKLSFWVIYSLYKQKNCVFRGLVRLIYNFPNVLPGNSTK